MGPRPLRWRGMHLPRDTGVIDDRVAAALVAGTWQSGLTRAAFALARPEDRAAVVGTGCGHLVALLAGKLGLPHVSLVEPDTARRTHVVALARLNGLPRLAFVEAADLPAVAPSLLFVDAAGVPPPRGAAWPALRAVAAETGDAPARGAAISTEAAAAGLAPDATLSTGGALVFCAV